MEGVKQEEMCERSREEGSDLETGRAGNQNHTEGLRSNPGGPVRGMESNAGPT